MPDNLSRLPVKRKEDFIMTNYKKIITTISFTLPFFLTACQSIETFLSDSGMRQRSSSDVVVNKVPRSSVSKSQVRERANTSAPAGQTSAVPSAVPNVVPSTPSSPSTSQVPSTPGGQAVVPNVAPSLGE